MTTTLSFNATSYNARNTPVHAADARVKILLLALVSATLFVVNTWWGLLVLSVGVVCFAWIARIPVAACARQFIPLGVLLALTVLFNAFTLSSSASADSGPFIGAFLFSLAGFEHGAYLALRIVVLVVASLVLTTTTTADDLLQALVCLTKPLTRLHLPMQDFCMMLTLALRFIPLTFDEIHEVRRAQISRGARFDSGGIWDRCRAWGNVFIPVFVGLFHKAARVGRAMDARCYGAENPTVLASRPLRPGSCLAGIAGAAVCILLCVGQAVLPFAGV